nr:tetratricopeptide repeat protein [Anaerolineae bacterium]
MTRAKNTGIIGIMREKWVLCLTVVVLIASIAVSVCACSQGSDSLPVATATLWASAPPASPIPSPTPTSTPTPIENIHMGERDLRNGNWDTAVIEFRRVLADPGSNESERAAAQIGLAQAALQSGSCSEALTALNSFIGAFPSHERIAHAYFLRGNCYAELGDYARAISDYQTYLTLKPGLIDSLVHERIGDAYIAGGQSARAAFSFEQALLSSIDLEESYVLREKLAEISRAEGNTQAAINQYEAILVSAEDYIYRARIEFLIGQTLFEAGDYDAAYTQLGIVFERYPQSYDALTALRDLLSANIPVDQFQRGLVNYFQGQYDIAIMAFTNYLDAAADDEIPAELYFYRAISYRALGRTDEAISDLEWLLEVYQPQTGDVWGKTWLELADIHAETGDIETALTLYQALAADYPFLSQAPDGLAAAGALTAGLGDLTRAEAFFRALEQQFPADSRAVNGLFDIGIAYLLRGEASAAEAVFRANLASAENPRPARDAFWLGKSLARQGRQAESVEAYQLAMSLEPERYYSFRAAELLGGGAPFSDPGEMVIPVDPDEGRAEAEQWLVTQFGLTNTPPLAETLREDIASDPVMLRSRELWDLGMPVEAKNGFDTVRTSYANDPLALYQLALYFREIGLYRSSILAAARLHTLASISPLEGPVFLARLRYPTYFQDLILTYATQYSLDPLLVFAIIEQESLFEGFAESRAAAQGLMQIWPPTGERIAAILNWPDYSVADLQRPYVNVNFGTWLLYDEFNRFDGDVYAVLAAYNAGSGRALTWQQQAQGDPDLFLELITLSEPRAYIEGIYRHFALYKTLYSRPEEF